MREFACTVISLAQKRRYLHEPAVAVGLDLLEKLPTEAIMSHALTAPGMYEWFQKAAETGNPHTLFFSVKFHEKVSMDWDTFGKFLPHALDARNFFPRENVEHLERCFKACLNWFCEVVIEGTLLQPSLDRKYLALNVFQLLARLPTSCINGFFFHKLVHCLMNLLLTKS